MDGVQRIRGLAGSGKTIVLALKTAYLHARHPDWKIAVTFNTRSLKGQLRQLINTFCIEQTSEEPNWDCVNIIHAWGASGGGEKTGIYYAFCSTNNVEYYDFLTARAKYGRTDTFGQVCAKALNDAKTSKPVYDAILIDEAQDFSTAFFQLCYELLKEPKRLVYAYDELQNLSSQSLPPPEIIFGNLRDGTPPKVKFEPHIEGCPQQDIILEKCYRNSRPALVTAHALGFGIYRNSNTGGSPLVQMFDQSNLWLDIGYKIADGMLKDGERVVLQRTTQTSPIFLEQHSAIDDLIVFKTFDSQEEHDHWVAQEIKNNLEKDELRPDDIIVINPDPLTTKKIVAPIRFLLFQYGITSHTAGIDTPPDVFFAENNESVAFSGIHRAKGNEAAMIYIINSQVCFNSCFDLAKLRNQLFTAITRSKAWVRVLGIGKSMQGLIAEYEQVKAHNFKLDFIYPNRTQRAQMNIVNRDTSESEKIRIKKNQKSIVNLIDDLENGQIFIEDLGEKQIARLRAILEKKENRLLNPKSIYIQIKTLTADLIKSSLCVSQHFPSITNLSNNITEIGITNSYNAIFLKNIPYTERYQEIIRRNCYNIKMIDGALLTLLYRFKNNRIVAHRLSYLPAPCIMAFQDKQEIYMNDEIYADVTDKRIMPVSIRFDFDSSSTTCKPIQHPISHLTLGQYKNCRIPVSSALTPCQFITFIVVSFYHTAYNKKHISIYKEKFEESLLPEEREYIHINLPVYQK